MRNNLTAALLVMLAMLLISSNDVIMKLESEHLGIGQLLFVRGLLATIIFSLLIKLSGRPIWPRATLSRWNGYRALCECGATVCFITGLSLLPIATASTLAWTAPIFLTIAAALILKERITHTRWIAVFVGFAGVLLVANPFGESVSLAMILPLVTAVFVCLRDIITRRLDPNLQSIYVTFTTLLVVTVAGGLLSIADWRPISAQQVIWLAVSAVFLGLGFLSQVSAVRLGELSFIAPFSFFGILCSVFYEYMVWHQMPTFTMFAGMGLIMGAGIYLLSSYRPHRRPSYISQRVP